MAVTPGHNFKITDLSTLAGQANGIGSSNFDLTHYQDVVPMNTDPSGNDYGYRILSSIILTARGSGYVIGDQLQGPNCTFEVTTVDGAGGALGLLTLTNVGYAPGSSGPTWETDNDPASPATLTNISSAGTGAQISFAISHIGPTAGYTFPDYAQPVGKVGLGTVYVVAGGTGYHVADVITAGGVTLSVATVGGGGVVAGLTYTSGTVSAFPCTALAGAGGTGNGLVVGLLFVLPARPNWLDELNRMRNNIWNLPLLNSGGTTLFPTVISGPALCTSGPWPVGGPTQNFTDTWFYFADTGSGASVTLTSPFTASVGKGTTQTRMSLIPASGIITQYLAGTFLWATMRFDFIIGGTSNVTLNGQLGYTCTREDGSDGVDARTLIAISTPVGTNAIPGAPVATLVGSFGVNFLWTFSGASLAPGRYSVLFTFTNPPNDTLVAGVGTSHTTAGIGFGDNLIEGSSLNATVSYSAAIPTNGIHNSKQIYKIQLPGDAGNLGPLIYEVNNYVVGGGVISPPQTWTAATLIGPDCWLVDTNGNVQTAISGGNFTTGLAMPTWQTSGPTADGTGFWEFSGPPPFNNPFSPPYPQPVYAPEVIAASGIGFSTSTPGLWTAWTQPISSLNIATEEQMPWNLARTKADIHGTESINPMLIGDLAPSIAGVPQVSNSYDQTLPVEKQIEPPAWKANTFYTQFFTIIDSAGNFQQAFTTGVSGMTEPTNWGASVGGLTGDNGLQWQCIKSFIEDDLWGNGITYATGAKIVDKNGNTQTATVGGISGAVEPTWNTVDLGITSDHGITWQMTIGSNFYVPALHRFPDIPRYPVYWISETIGRMKPPTGAGSGMTIFGFNNQWQRNLFSGGHDNGWQQDNMAFGWWLYSIAINRQSYNTPAIPVTLGCIRNGAFVAFGTFNTGQVIHELWPVFTSDALVYQCAERVDVQAVALASALPSGMTCTTPALVAAYVNDTSGLLSLIT